MSAPPDSKRRVRMLPRSGRPEDALSFLGAEVGNATLQSVVTITFHRDGSVDYRGFGDVEKRDVVLALERLKLRILEDE